MRISSRLPARASAVALLLAVLLHVWTSAQAQEYHNLPLTRPGQAAIAIDRASRTGYIFDFGQYKDGKDLSLSGRPVLDAFADARVEHLVVVCSHPHADHMGGIKALFSQPRQFFKDDAMRESRFSSITVVENGVTSTLANLLKAGLPAEAKIKVTRASATAGNALEGISLPSHEVFVETVPYKAPLKAGPHGRSVVTRIVLGGKFSILDFDDADTPAIHEVVSTLRSRGITKIDAFVVPHHGSAAHDIAPILELRPSYAVLTVNPENKYSHPSPEILLELVRELGADHVTFTGAIGGVDFGPTGVTQARYTAKDADSYALFILPGRQRAERRGGRIDRERLAKYEELRQLMLANPTPGPRQTQSVAERVAATGTMLSPELDIGTIPAAGSTPSQVRERRMFAVGRPLADPEPPLYVTASPSSPDLPGSGAVNAREFATRRAMATPSPVTSSSVVKLHFDTEAGLADGLEPPAVTPTAGPTTTPSSALPTARKLPEGGMVFLTAGRLTAQGNATALMGGTLDLRQDGLCIRTLSGASYAVPIKLDPLFCEIWSRVYERGIDAFYLSINPTRRFLARGDSALDHVPHDRLAYGASKRAGSVAANEVVTSGDIAHSQIGRILWQADVLFKSAAMGKDVLTGDVPPRPIVTTALSAGPRELTAEDLDSSPADRWCRLFWTSGPQEITLDEVNKRVVFKGNAVVAEAEAMKLSGGTLTSDPRRCWCADAKALAKELQRQANGSSASPTLLELRRLAEAQTFVRWVRINGLAVSPQVRQAIDAAGTLRPFDVPSWTSGIRSNPKVLVQEERSIGGRIPTYLVHVSFSEPSVMVDCLKPEWDKRLVEFPRAGLRFDRSKQAWIGPHDKAFLRTWMTSLATRVAGCAAGQLLPADAVVRDEDSLDDEEQESFGIVPHLQSVSYHGGVLLGPLPSAGFLRTAWQKSGALRDLQGRLIFQRSDSTLHFWHTSVEHDSELVSAEHVVIRGARVVDAYASDGRLRFLVACSPGAVVREEYRGKHERSFPRGLEWARVRHAGGAEAILNKAIWPCRSKAADCIEGADVPTASVGSFPDSVPAGWSSRVALVEPSTWIVDLDIASVRQSLDQLWQARDAGDDAGLLSVASSYANWGFGAEAKSKSAEIVQRIEGESQDTNLQSGLVGGGDDEFRRSLLALLIGLRVAGLSDEIAAKTVTASETCTRLRRYERQLADVPPNLARLVWSEMADASHSAIESLRPTPQTTGALTALESSYTSRSRRCEALQGKLTGTAPKEEDSDDAGQN